MAPHPVVVKLGGSLLDLPGLGTRLRQWLDALSTPEVLLLVGGGPSTDVLRRLDQLHGIGEERCHWLALRALSFNSHLAAALVSDTEVVSDFAACAPLWRRGKTPILDPLPLMLADEKSGSPLPHSWAVTSDSVAARVAQLFEARELMLLKSRALRPGESWEDMARSGLVDEWFLGLSATLPAVRLVNFRAVA